MMERDWRLYCAELRGEELPEEQPFSLVWPRSRCPACGHAITAMENVPVLSWLYLRGQCSACHASISPRYPLVETISGLSCAFAAFHFGYGWAALGAMLLIWCLVALTCIDFDTQLLPDSITLPLLWLDLLFNVFGIYTDLQSAVIGAAALRSIPLPIAFTPSLSRSCVGTTAIVLRLRRPVHGRAYRYDRTGGTE
jgi:leader peptidase (prepilin peptidase)/N-methyltransferase